VHEGKRHPGDFTLWKATTDTQACWDSPFGPGRPGWHIECSAMIAQYTNKPLDFHLGGMDLKFPHHENEIAQSESCTGHALAHCWVHGGFVTVNQEKMSKSLQNFTYLDGILSAIGRNAMRYFYLSTHYRQPLEMIPEKLTQAQNAIRALESTLMEHVPESLTTGKQYDSSIVAALSVDLNTPQALTLFHEAVKNLKKLPQDQRSECAAALYATACDLLGFDFSDNKKILLSDLDDAVQGLIKQRQNAKRDKDFKAADSLRALIATHGYQIVDLADGYDILPIKKS
jgi:cysteinyl-tRNA synthetase